MEFSSPVMLLPAPGTSKDRSMPTHRKRPRDFSHAGVLVFDMLCIKKKNLSGNPVLRKK
jgi:hypothetical protein